MQLTRCKGKPHLGIATVLFFLFAIVLSACGFVSAFGTTSNNSLVDALGSDGNENESKASLSQATDLRLRLFDGEYLTLSELRGKVIVVNFWASWCPPCRDEAPVFEKVWNAYKDKNVVFVGVDVQDNESDARAFIKRFGITYANGPDSSRRILEDWGVTNIPTTFFITKDGKVARKWTGPLNENQLVTLVESLTK